MPDQEDVSNENKNVPLPAGEEALYEYTQAQKVQRDYCCAGCWGHLVLMTVRGKREVKVTCLQCGDGRGFVTKHYAERRQSESLADAFDVRINLRGVLKNSNSGKSAEQITKEIGH